MAANRTVSSENAAVLVGLGMYGEILVEKRHDIGRELAQRAVEREAFEDLVIHGFELVSSERLAQPADGGMQSRAYRPERNLEHRRDLFVGEFLTQPQVEGFPHFLGQPENGLAHKRQPRVFTFPGRLHVENHSLTRDLAVTVVPGKNITRDAEEPRPRRDHRIGLFAAAQDLEESLLKQIVRGVWRTPPHEIAQHATGVLLGKVLRRDLETSQDTSLFIVKCLCRAKKFAWTELFPI